MNEGHFPYPHDTDPDIFREALAHSEATTGFPATLIERDYYCSLVLQHLFSGDYLLMAHAFCSHGCYCSKANKVSEINK